MSFLTDVTAIIGGVAQGFTHNILAVIIAVLIGFWMYLKWGKPKPVNMAELMFKKEWEATTEQLRMLKPKMLALCPYPQSTEELKSAIGQIKYDLIGKVIGVNVVGVRTSVKDVVKLAKNFNETELKEFTEKNAAYIQSDKFWVVLAIERRIGGRFLFPKVTKSLLYLKPSQIIDFNSKDDVIRVRGFGLTPQGQYLLLNDEKINLNLNQLVLDQENIMGIETVTSSYSKLGEIVEYASGLDSGHTKRLVEGGLRVQETPTSTEVKT